MAKDRLEAFSDGVFAIAITLLVLNLAVPDFNHLGAGGLAATLLGEWPAFATFAVSFAVIGIIWVNHYALFAAIRRVDRPLLLAYYDLSFAVRSASQRASEGLGPHRSQEIVYSLGRALGDPP